VVRSTLEAPTERRSPRAASSSVPVVIGAARGEDQPASIWVKVKVALTALLVLAGSVSCAPPSGPLLIRVVVITTFESGPDTAPGSGEFRNWVQRLPLPETIDLPIAYHPLRYNPALGVLGIVTGEGAERAAASIMALGADRRFDLSHAYFVLAGIAGVDPRAASVGSAAWSKWIVNGDLANEVDAREIPPSWPTGIVPFDRAVPYGLPAAADDSIDGKLAYRLNASLVAWAYRQTQSVTLPDTPNLQRVRAAYPGFPNAQRPPFVLLGDTQAGDRFFLGESMTEWARRWTSYWTGGAGRFTMSAEEDAGVMQALTFLGAGGRVDRNRVLDLRAASDYVLPPAGQSPMQRLAATAAGAQEPAYDEALEAAYAVGSVVVKELVTQWDRYRDEPPS